MLKSFEKNDYSILFSLVEKAYVSYMLARNREKRNSILQKITSVLKEAQDIEIPIPDEGKVRKYLVQEEGFFLKYLEESDSKLKSQICLAATNVMIQLQRKDNELVTERRQNSLSTMKFLLLRSKKILPTMRW